MLVLLNTAERAGNLEEINNYVLSRHIFAYIEAKKHIGDVVLELGSGNGYGMKMLSEYCRNYIGVDKFKPNRLALNVNTAFFKSNLPDLSNIGSNSFDTIICFQVIEHIREDRKLIGEIFRVLKPGGSLLLTTPNNNMSITRNPFHVREYNESTIIELFKNSFESFNVYGVYGNKKVISYYFENKNNVEKILKWDVLNLHQILPACILKIPYNILNNLNRISLYKKQRKGYLAIYADDFYMADMTDECLDFFVIATK